MDQKLTVLFDLDGTLVDTAPDLIRAHNHVMKKFGYPTKSINELKNAVGKGAKAIMAKGNGKWEWFDEKIKNEMTDEFLSFYKKNILHESTLLNGVKEFLTWCKNQNISMAVCTNKTEHLAIDLLKKIEIYDFFEYVSGHNTFEYCKPDPRHLLRTIEMINGDKNKSIMIGDSETDANAAKEAEIPMILLKYGYTEKRSEEIYHNHLIKDFIGIEKIISKYL
ncbi:HAD-IA family hydrolase [Candidatus Pelagibacter bacterium]|nr:HAD-IA family hydrolase [Candidatus Pelagibacter bacterium]MDB2654929.1 HAD-IA family hydrolase [Candidatus Pelagibacter bacterium]